MKSFDIILKGGGEFLRLQTGSNIALPYRLGKKKQIDALLLSLTPQLYTLRAFVL
jgi:hypothetical protein